ncbi:MAG: phosphatase PAP2 family protein [Proteobacteria bacterium]|nr:phosphatase PAP2 family protein [Pseudomonadota bacterium]
MDGMDGLDGMDGMDGMDVIGASAGRGSAGGGLRRLGVTPAVLPVTTSPLDWNGERFPGTAAASWGPMSPAVFGLREWTPDNWTVALMSELVQQTVTGVTWTTALTAAGAADDWTMLSAAERSRELEELRNLIEFRSGALAEIMAQRNGIIGYMRSVVYFTRASHPKTYLLVAAALRAGQFLAMHYKYRYKRPRPATVQPGLVPPIDAPGHAAYPSGHATESMLVALMLEQILPASVIPAGGAEAGPLRILARRIARNREVVGLHYPSDARIAFKLAAKTFPLLLNCPSIAGSVGTPTPTAPTAVITDPRPAVPVTEAVTSTGVCGDGILAGARLEWT